jgi:hypothetical protein
MNTERKNAIKKEILRWVIRVEMENLAEIGSEVERQAYEEVIAELKEMCARSTKNCAYCKMC